MDDSKLSSTPTIARHPTFWFDDGSIIIYVQETAFKVHRSHLARHSEIFEDLFSVPRPPDSPTLEGCPIVYLPDRQSDFVDLLKALYDPLYFDTLVPDASLTLRLAFIECILRLSTKYFIMGLRSKCISILTNFILDHFDRVLLPSRKEDGCTWTCKITKKCLWPLLEPLLGFLQAKLLTGKILPPDYDFVQL